MYLMIPVQIGATRLSCIVLSLSRCVVIRFVCAVRSKVPHDLRHFRVSMRRISSPFVFSSFVFLTGPSAVEPLNVKVVLGDEEK